MSRLTTIMLASSLALLSAAPMAVAAPGGERGQIAWQQQNVDWMPADTASYLGSIGMDVMVPSWIPSPFTGVPPDVYAGGGSYSLYWMAPGSTPTFLHITGVVGADFPAGSKADLNVQLSINADVQGWPAIRDIGIPAGSSTPIYDQVWWIANGVRYSVESNNIGTDSLTIANSMLFLEAPVYVEPTSPPVYEEPYVPPVSEPVSEEPVYEAPVSEGAVAEEPVSSSAGDTSSTTGTSSGSGGSTGGDTGATSSSPGTTDGSEPEGPWSPGKMDANFPSDGTSGPRPPVIGGDGTGGLYDTSLPRIIDARP